MSCSFHEVPGRLRIKIAELKQQPLRAKSIPSLFEHAAGVERIAVNPVTGSIKIFYDPNAVSSQRLLGILQQAGIEPAAGCDSAESHAFATRATRTIGKAMVNWALSRTLESNGLGLLAALI